MSYSLVFIIKTTTIKTRYWTGYKKLLQTMRKIRVSLNSKTDQLGWLQTILFLVLQEFKRLIVLLLKRKKEIFVRIRVFMNKKLQRL